MYKEEFCGLIADSAKNLKGKEIAIAFSGGVDSTLLALVISKIASVSLYVVGTKGSYDIKAAKSAAKILKLPLTVIKITEDDIEKGIHDTVKILDKNNLVNKTDMRTIITVAFNLPLYFVAKHAKEKTIATGQGPDNFLGGYSVHLGMSRKNLDHNLKKSVGDMLSTDLPQYAAICNAFGKQVVAPYLDKRILAFAMKLPLSKKVNKGKRKLIMVEAAKKLGLPEELAERKKKSAQYGSGIMDAIKNIAKRRKVRTSQLPRRVLGRL
jgi:asparagine synthase (glutamine-hydrolysing)